MTRTRAVTQLAHCVLGVAVFFVWPGFVVVRMATGTIRLKGRTPPIDDLGVRLVALRAPQVTPVILRLVWQRDVAVVRWRPCVRDVAGVAFLRGVEVTRVLSRRRSAIVTGCTRAKHLRVIDRHHGREHVRRMAVFTDIGRQWVRGVLAGRIRAVVATDTVSRNVYVIEIRR